MNWVFVCLIVGLFWCLNLCNIDLLFIKCDVVLYCSFNVGWFEVVMLCLLGVVFVGLCVYYGMFKDFLWVNVLGCIDVIVLDIWVLMGILW